MKTILAQYPDYIDLLCKNEKYTLCVPSDAIISQRCEVDPRFVQEHVLEALPHDDSIDYRSLAGTCYKMVEHELHRVDNEEIFCSMLRSDLYYLPDNKRSLRRIMLSNTIDQRFYRPLENEV